MTILSCIILMEITITCNREIEFIGYREHPTTEESKMYRNHHIFSKFSNTLS